MVALGLPGLPFGPPPETTKQVAIMFLICYEICFVYFYLEMWYRKQMWNVIRAFGLMEANHQVFGDVLPTNIWSVPIRRQAILSSPPCYIYGCAGSVKRMSDKPILRGLVSRRTNSFQIGRFCSPNRPYISSQQHCKVRGLSSRWGAVMTRRGRGNQWGVEQRLWNGVEAMYCHDHIWKWPANGSKPIPTRS